MSARLAGAIEELLATHPNFQGLDLPKVWQDLARLAQPLVEVGEADAGDVEHLDAGADAGGVARAAEDATLDVGGLRLLEVERCADHAAG